MLHSLWKFISGAFTPATTTTDTRGDPFQVGAIVSTKYRWDGLWYSARIKSKDPNDTFTISFEWGCWQMNTSATDMKLITNEPDRRAFEAKERGAVTQMAPPAATSGDQGIAGGDGDDVWLAARRGDLDTLVTLVRNGGPLDEPEVFEHDQAGERAHERGAGGGGKAVGRTPLYWACLCGHSEVVEWLLRNGARDVDGSAFAAVTGSRPVRHQDDERDLVFDPDENIYSDFVERSAGAHVQSTLDIDALDANSARIRQLLAEYAAQAPHDAAFASQPSALTSTSGAVVQVRMVGGTGVCPMPERVYAYDVDQPETKVCVVCTTAQVDGVSVPCGHAVACMECLHTIRSAREYGCPLCRSQIRDIVRLEVVKVIQSPNDDVI
jgi:hypothetical protein